MRPIPPGSAFSVNQRFPSGPVTMSAGSSDPDSPLVNSVIVPPVLIRPMRPVPFSVNQSVPSGPLVIAVGSAAGSRPVVNSVIEPPVVILPDHVRGRVDVPEVSVRAGRDVGGVTHGRDRELRDHAGLRHARNRAVGRRPWATHRLPSGPVTIPRGLPVGKPAVNSLMIGAGRDPPHAVVRLLGEPEVPVGPRGDAPEADAGLRPVVNSEIDGPLRTARHGNGGPRPKERDYEQRRNAGLQTHTGCIDATVRHLMERLSARWPRPVKSALRHSSCSSTSSSYSR